MTTILLFLSLYTTPKVGKKRNRLPIHRKFNGPSFCGKV